MTRDEVIHLYAACVGFSVGAWIVVSRSYIVQVQQSYANREKLWRLPWGLGLWVASLVTYALTVAAALHLQSTAVTPDWRLALYWLALIFADAGVILIELHVRRHGFPNKEGTR